MDAPVAELASPLLFLSSRDGDWEGLVAQVVHEPVQTEGWVVPASPNPSLVFVTGGALRVEWRQAHDLWAGRDVRPGELILTWGIGPSHEMHWRSLTAIPTETLRLQLSREMVARVGKQMADMDLASLHLVPHVGFQDPLLTQIALALRREMEEPTPMGTVYTHSAAQLLAVHLVRHYTSICQRTRADSPSPVGLAGCQIEQVLDFIRAHLSEELSLEVLAQQTGYSPDHFARLFQRTTGETPHQVVVRQRIECAKRLLSETALPLVRIAGDSGFPNQSYFTRVFKRTLGVTPRAYRQARHAHHLSAF